MKPNKLNWARPLIFAITFVTLGGSIVVMNNAKKQSTQKTAIENASPTQIVLTDREKELNYYFAVKAINEGNYQKAINKLEVVISTDPTKDTAYYLLGYALRRMGETEKSISCYEKFYNVSTPENPYRLLVMIELGYLYAQQNKFDAAKKIIEQAEKESEISGNIESIEKIKKLKNYVFNVLGMSLVKSENIKDAIKCYEEATKAVNDEFTAAHLNYAALLVDMAKNKCKKGNTVEAMENLNKAENFLKLPASKNWKTYIEKLSKQIKDIQSNCVKN